MKVGGVSIGGGGLILTSSHDDMLTSIFTVGFHIGKQVFIEIRNIFLKNPKTIKKSLNRKIIRVSNILFGTSIERIFH